MKRQRQKLGTQGEALKRQRQELDDQENEMAHMSAEKDNSIQREAAMRVEKDKGIQLEAAMRALLGAVPMANGGVDLAHSPALPALAAQALPALAAPAPPALAALGSPEVASPRYVPVPGATDPVPEDTKYAEQLTEDTATPSLAFFQAVFDTIEDPIELIILNHKLRVCYINRRDRVTGEQIFDRKKFLFHRPLPSGAH